MWRSKPPINGAAREMLSSRLQGDPDPSLTGAKKLRSETHAILHLTLEELREEIQECILKCLDCQRICLKVVDRRRRSKHATLLGRPDVRSLLNCSEICATAARFMLRGSEFDQRLCLLCADVCKSWAGQWTGVVDDGEIQECVAACLRCAECCDRVAGVTTRRRDSMAREV